MRFALKLAPLSLVALALLAACGGDSTPTPTLEPTATATPAPTATPTAEPVGEPTGSDSTGGPPAGIDLNSLLSIAEVQAAFPTLTSITTSEIDFYAMALNADPSQVVGMDAFKGLVFESSGGAGLTLALVDFESVELAEAHLILSAAGLDATSVDGSDEAHSGQGGGVSAIVTRKGDLGVSVNVSGLPETKAELEAASALAALALSRID